MPHIRTLSDIKKIMNEYNLKFHKGLGQNFLFDTHYLDKIVSDSNITKDDVVIEIGPGLGVLTTRLAEYAKKVIAIEIDKYLIPALQSQTSDYSNIEIINADVMKFDLKTLIENENSLVKIVANLPYYITTPIIMKLLESKLPIESIVVMIQKEVAQRLCAKNATKDYGAITLAVNYYTNPKILFFVPPGAFIPPPKVESAVIKLDVLKEPAVKTDDEKLFFKVIKAAFGQRRKTLLNALHSTFSHIDKQTLKNIIISCDIREDARGETLTIENFSEISQKISKY